MSTNVKIAVIVLLTVNIFLTVYYKYKENYDECVRIDYELKIEKLDEDHSGHSPPKKRRPESVSETF